MRSFSVVLCLTALCCHMIGAAARVAPDTFSTADTIIPARLTAIDPLHAKNKSSTVKTSTPPIDTQSRNSSTALRTNHSTPLSGPLPRPLASPLPSPLQDKAAPIRVKETTNGTDPENKTASALTPLLSFVSQQNSTVEPLFDHPEGDHQRIVLLEKLPDSNRTILHLKIDNETTVSLEALLLDHLKHNKTTPTKDDNATSSVMPRSNKETTEITSFLGRRSGFIGARGDFNDTAKDHFIMPVHLDNIFSAMFMLLKSRNDTAAAGAHLEQGTNNRSTTVAPNATHGLSAAELRQRAIAHRVLTLKRNGTSDVEVQRLMLDPSGSSLMGPETVLAVQYDNRTEQGWVALQLPGTGYVDLGKTSIALKYVSPWFFDVLVLPLQAPTGGAACLNGSDGLAQLRALEQFANSLVRNDVLKRHIIKAKDAEVRSVIEADFPYGDMEVVEQRKAALRRQARHRRKARRSTRMSILHALTPRDPTGVSWQLKVGFAGTISAAHDYHLYRTVSHERLKIAIKVLDQIPLSSFEKSLLVSDYRKYTGEHTALPSAASNGTYDQRAIEEMVSKADIWVIEKPRNEKE